MSISGLEGVLEYTAKNERGLLSSDVAPLTGLNVIEKNSLPLKNLYH